MRIVSTLALLPDLGPRLDTRILPTYQTIYRLTTTFNASPTSYRLPMFLKLFSSAARPPNKSLIELREALFETHGAPP
jgi:hypothetical protein